MGKTSDLPIKLLRQLAYLFNLNPTHVGYTLLKKDLSMYKAGHKGEKSINYFLYPIVYKNYLRFYNLRLYYQGQNFEIDLLLITNQFLLIIEVKNYRGTLYLDHDSGGLIQVFEDQVKLYQDPTLQVERQRELLSEWLKLKGYHVPIETLVCLVNQNGILKRDNQTSSQIIYGHKLAYEYQELQKRYQNHPHVINPENLMEILITENNPLDPSLMHKYKIEENDFAPGVVCLNCFKKSMVRERNTYICKNCSNQDPGGLMRGLKDYFLIYGPQITNEKARLWLGENNTHFMRKNLYRFTDKKIGTNKGTTYILDFNYDEDFNHMISYLRQL
ncbi:nuclease-related domain-containing protein [Piscibacillus sp. B03]|uniref:nuclease-related domain-containing protein n=1 Tax=Piscibacillus sp. B03 TaxID=3457430 RepID=UPI003FCCF02D